MIPLFDPVTTLLVERARYKPVDFVANQLNNGEEVVWPEQYVTLDENFPQEAEQNE